MQSRSIRRSGQPTCASASRMRAFDWDLIRGRHYGQRSCEPRKQAEHMAAPTSCRGEESPCQRGAVHTWHNSDLPRCPPLRRCQGIADIKRARSERPCRAEWAGASCRLHSAERGLQNGGKVSGVNKDSAPDQNPHGRPRSSQHLHARLWCRTRPPVVGRPPPRPARIFRWRAPWCFRGSDATLRPRALIARRSHRRFWPVVASGHPKALR